MRTFQHIRPLSLIISLAAAVLLIGAGLKIDSEVKQGHFLLRVLASSRGYTFLDQRGVVLQKGHYDCGPAVLQMLLVRLGHPVTLEALENEAMDNSKGTSVERMLLVLREYGVPAYARRMPRDQWMKTSLPFISLTGNDHYILVASQLDAGDFEILDPAVGRGQITRNTLFRTSGGILIAPLMGMRTTISAH